MVGKLEKARLHKGNKNWVRNHNGNEKLMRRDGPNPRHHKFHGQLFNRTQREVTHTIGGGGKNRGLQIRMGFEELSEIYDYYFEFISGK